MAKTKNKKSKTGCKGKYNKDFPLLAEGYAREGLSDEQIAEKLGISIQTYYNYQNKHLEFLEAVKRGKAPVDIEVENALLKRALGYEYEEVKITDKTIDGKTFTEIQTTKKHMPASETAMIFWLKNRKPKQWNDKQQIEHSGNAQLMIYKLPDNGRDSEEEEVHNK